MEIIIYNYKISPYSGNTCWKIQEKQDKEDAKIEWRDPYYYPSTLKYALIQTRELVRLDSKKNFKSLDAALDELRTIDEEFMNKLDELKAQYPDNFR